MALPDIRAVFGRMRAWALEREPMAEEPELSPDAEPWLRAPSIEAVETEIARCRELVVQTMDVLEAAHALARELGCLLDEARLEQQQTADVP